jgi:hypothetical protein
MSITDTIANFGFSSQSQVQDQIAEDYLKQFERPMSVSVMKKLKKWPMLQELGFNGQLGHMKETFHGLKEFNVHMDMYSQTHDILKRAWLVIKNLAPKNPFVALKLFFSQYLGNVGKLFKSIHNFEQIFAVNPDTLLRSQDTGKVTEENQKLMDAIDNG